ncbi:MAG: class I SAM-dependent methyltransferase [Opitutae bacterium]|nr:class I SAM-dependent methyltransferase [Opitutae bacterium]
MKLHQTRRHWDRLADTDALWAVLTTPDKKGNRWPIDEFFATGRTTVDAELAGVRALCPDLESGAALDFGCGVGRLTQGLAPHFARVVGIDLSEKMLARAREHNRHGDRVRYLHNPHPDLRLLADNQFDFVYSLITLQHMEPEYAKAYIAEFVRVAAPGGAILFQVPSQRPAEKPIGPLLTSSPELFYKRARRRLRRLWRIWFVTEPLMEMHALPRAEVEALLGRSGAEILNVYRYDAAGSALESWGYLARKK